MGRISPLVRAFLDRHPSDCARILEQLDINTVCSLISSVQPRIAAGILECMMTAYGAECLRLLDTPAAASRVKEMKMPQSARLLRAMDTALSERILNAVPSYVRNSIHEALRYPEQTVGRIMDSNPFCLPESMPAAEALKRVRKFHQQTVHDIFVVDDDHRLRGAIRIAELLSAPRTSSLQAVMIRDIPFLYARAAIGSAAQASGWNTFGSLPVVEKDHTLSGVLKSSTLMHVLAEARGAGDATDALQEIFSLAKMYWLVMAELVNTVAGDIKGKRSR